MKRVRFIESRGGAHFLMERAESGRGETVILGTFGTYEAAAARLSPGSGVVVTPGLLRPCRWSFDDDTIFDGFTNDTYWNGWLNVWVTPEVHAQVLAHVGPHDPEVEDFEGTLHSLKVGPNDGLFCYGWGFCASEVEPGDEPGDDRRGMWAARCECRNGHSSTSGRCNVRDVVDPVALPGGAVMCERCRKECVTASPRDYSDARRDATVARIKQEVATMLAEEEMPGTVRSFSELHDYCDANCLGGLCDDNAVDDASSDTAANFLNAVQDAVDTWLAAGGHVAHRLHPALEEEAAAASVRRGMGICDGCGGLWTDGAYCPSCGLFAEGGDLGRCPDCGAAVEYVDDAWRHVDPTRACFLHNAREVTRVTE